MKKLVIGLAAALVALSFAACNKNNAGGGSAAQEDKTPAQVALSFSFDQTPEMMEYCYVQVYFESANGSNQTILLKTDDVDAQCRWNALVSSHQLPASFTFRRTVTLREDISSLEEFSYSKGISYQYALYNAAGTQVFLSDFVDNLASSKLNGTKVAELVKAGKLDRTCTFSFDAEGKMTKQFSTSD